MIWVPVSMCRGVNRSKILLELRHKERGLPRPCIIRCMLANSDWVINFGTLILAAAAIVSAWISVVSLKSSKNVLEAATTQSKATVELVEIARAELTASYLPLLADVPQHRDEFVGDVDHFPTVKEGGGGQLVSIPVRNVGPGPAFVKFAFLRSADGVGFDVKGEVAQSVTMSGETTVALFSSSSNDPSFQSQFRDLIKGAFQVIVLYSDFTNNRRRKTTLHIPADKGRNRIFSNVEVHECDKNWNVTGTPLLVKRNENSVTTASD